MINKGICAYCGKEFDFVKREDGKGYHKTKYCSKECEKERWAKELEDKYAWTNCEYCGKKFKREKKISGRGYKDRKFCSIDCENKHHRQISEEKYGWGICIVCNKKFKQNRVNSGYYSFTQFCSKECKNKYADIKYPNRIVYCAYCGKRTPLKPYGTKKGSYITVKFCNSDCEQKYYAEVYGKKKCINCGKDFNRPIYIDYRGQREYKRGFVFDYCDDCRKNIPRKTSEAEYNFSLALQENKIDYDSQEFRIEDFYYDFHITNFNILIDINPSFTHTIKPNFINIGKDKDYHYNRLETAAKHGYLYICVWDWSDITDIIKILKQVMKDNKKYKLKSHEQPKLLYNIKDTNKLVSEKEYLDYIGKDSYYCLPVYNCGKYIYEDLDIVFDVEI